MLPHSVVLTSVSKCHFNGRCLFNLFHFEGKLWGEKSKENSNDFLKISFRKSIFYSTPFCYIEDNIIEVKDLSWLEVLLSWPINAPKHRAQIYRKVQTSPLCTSNITVSINKFWIKEWLWPRESNREKRQKWYLHHFQNYCSPKDTELYSVTLNRLHQST